MATKETAKPARRRLRPKVSPQPAAPFNLREFLDSAGIARTIVKYARSADVYTQGDVAAEVFYLQKGSIKLSVLSSTGKDDEQLLIPKLSQETLAEIVGTTRSRINFFMNKFRDLGFVEYNGDIRIHRSLLSVVLHD